MSFVSRIVKRTHASLEVVELVGILDFKDLNCKFVQPDHY